MPTSSAVAGGLGIETDEIDGGHCLALGRPELLAARLDGYVRELDAAG